MPKKSRIHYSSQKKMEILKKHLVDRVPVSDVCEKYGIAPSMFYNWQKRLFEGGSTVFEQVSRGKTSREDKISKLESKIVQKDEVIAEIMAEFIASKKKEWGPLKGMWVEPDVRDDIVRFITKWTIKTDLSIKWHLRRLQLRESKYYAWCNREGAPNRHNGRIPKGHWTTPDEQALILAYQAEHPDDGYRVLTYMMMDDEVVAVSPTTTYRVLSKAGRLKSWERKSSSKGDGFEQPSAPHEHWHIDIAYVNILGTFYYLCSVLDGYSRLIVHWNLRESMKEVDVEIVLEKAIEKAGRGPERLISDNGPQFIARDFKSYLRIKGMNHVKTSPYYPQSNGKVERVQKTVKADAIRKTVILSYEDAVDCLEQFITFYNEKRLHSAIGYVAPRDKMEGRAPEIQARRDEMLKQARAMRRQRRQATLDDQHDHFLC